MISKENFLKHYCDKEVEKNIKDTKDTILVNRYAYGNQLTQVIVDRRSGKTERDGSISVTICFKHCKNISPRFDEINRFFCSNVIPEDWNIKELDICDNETPADVMCIISPTVEIITKCVVEFNITK